MYRTMCSVGLCYTTATADALTTTTTMSTTTWWVGKTSRYLLEKFSTVVVSRLWLCRFVG